MNKLILHLSLIVACCSFTLPAAEVDFSRYFPGKEGCLLLYDLKANKVVYRFNEKRCALRLAPCSTFKVALSLMAFDKGILKDETTTFKWDGVDHGNPGWNRDTSAADWMRNSVLWYSQRITPQLGPKTINDYLARFDYGNRDITGGLTTFWLGSTLKISADEQLRFWERFWRGVLPVSRHATEITKKIIYLETSASGMELSGKTGSCTTGQEELGWFVGHLSGPKGEYLIIANYTGPAAPTKEYPGLITKGICLEILTNLKLH
jgi:beta-lactamase class D